MTNKEIVQTAFDNFSKGNIPAILEVLSDDVTWEFNGPSILPFAGLRKGKEGALDFFMQLSTSSDVTSFIPKEYIAEGDRVIALGEATATAKQTGKTAHNRWVMAWTFKEGKVTHYHNYSDTYDLAQSFMN
jgi:ketosteroid isomerase-like protein